MTAIRHNSATPLLKKRATCYGWGFWGFVGAATLFATLSVVEYYVDDDPNKMGAVIGGIIASAICAVVAIVLKLQLICKNSKAHQV